MAAGITVLFGWMSLVGVVRAEFLLPVISTTSARRRRLASAIAVHPASYVAKCHGRYPHLFTVYLCSSITTLTSLDFLGFGLPPVHRHSANCCYKGKITFRPRAWDHRLLVGGDIVVFADLYCEAVRDAFDPNKAV